MLYMVCIVCLMHMCVTLYVCVLYIYIHTDIYMLCLCEIGSHVAVPEGYSQHNSSGAGDLTQGIQPFELFLLSQVFYSETLHYFQSITPQRTLVSRLTLVKLDLEFQHLGVEKCGSSGGGVSGSIYNLPIFRTHPLSFSSVSGSGGEPYK